MISLKSLHLPLTLDTPYPIEYDGKMHSKFIDQQLVKHGSIMFKIILSTMKQCAMDFTRASQEADEMCL